MFQPLPDCCYYTSRTQTSAFKPGSVLNPASRLSGGKDFPALTSPSQKKKKTIAISAGVYNLLGKTQTMLAIIECSVV